MTRLLGLLLMHICTGAMANQSQQPSLRLVSDVYCPFTCEAGGESRGYLVDLAQAASAGSSRLVEYQVYPWERALVLVSQGLADGVLAVSERRSAGLLRSSVVGFDVVAFNALVPVQLPANGREDFSWLDAFRLGLAPLPLAPDDAYEHYLKQRRQLAPGAIVTVTGENASALLVRMLMSGRIQAVMENPQVVKYLMHREFPQAHLWQFDVTKPRPLYIALRDTPANRDWLTQFELGLAQMRLDGRLDALMARYGLVDWYGGGGGVRVVGAASQPRTN